MPEILFNGPAGRIDARYKLSSDSKAPLALFLHPHPQFGGTMNNSIIYQLYYLFAERNFSVLRFNFRGAGKSKGTFDHGVGELSDAAAALDWGQALAFEARHCWVIGFSFGAWIGMQLLMRRPEIKYFISIAPPANLYDFSFLAPCPGSGLIVSGSDDKVAHQGKIQELVDKLKNQRSIVVDHQVIDQANHFFENHTIQLIEMVANYIERTEPNL